MTSLTVFEFETREIRVVGTPDNPEWVAKDVCDALEITWSGATLKEFDDDEKGCCTVMTRGGEQEMTTVTEPGLYRLIFTSRKPAAKLFKRWVVHEVLPAIRNVALNQPPVDAGSINNPDREWTVSDRLTALGYPVQSIGTLAKIGKCAARLYRFQHKAEPPIRLQYVDGATREVNGYRTADLKLLDHAIADLLGGRLLEL